MVVKLLAPAAVTALLLTAAGPGQATAQQAVAQQASAPSTALASDSSFLQTAGSLGLLQVKLGKLAEEKGSSPAVRDFGKRMVADYSKANEDLAAAAKGAAYPAPAILRQHAQLYERFVRMGKGSFDKKYMAEMTSQHGDAARLFQAEAEGGKVASLKALAGKMLPTVQQHSALAAQTAGAVGADVTAVAGGRQGS
jgi:putative membrane protein